MKKIADENRQLKDALSSLKIKIGTRLNEALA